MIIQGKLTYTPRCCVNCGVLNQSHQDIIKNGTKVSTIKLTHINFQPLLLRLKKQRFLCKHCHQTFIAETTLVELHCFISTIIKQTIAMELREIQSMTLVAQHLSVSLNTHCIRVMNNLYSKRPRDYRKLKKQWQLLLKNDWELNVSDYRTHRLYDGLMTEKMMVDYLLSLDPQLRQVYMLVNHLRFALYQHDFEQFSTILEDTRQQILPRKIRTTVQTLVTHRVGINNACFYTLSNGAIEGINNKIKTMKRSGFGYRNYTNLRARILVGFRLTINHFEPKALRYQDDQAIQKEKAKVRI